MRIKQFLSKLIFISSVTLIAFSSHAQGKHIIAAAQLSGLFQTQDNPEGLGVYHRLLSRILYETGLEEEYQLVVMPMKRAKTEFLRGHYACYSPGEDTFGDDEVANLPHDILSSRPFNRALVRIVSTNGERLIHGLDDITDKDVLSIVRGVPVNWKMREIMQRAGKTFTVQSELENLQMLVSGRVNLIFAFYPDILFAYKEMGMGVQFPYAKDYSPLVINDNIICHAKHKKALELIDDKLAEYQRSGLLKLLLQDFYVSDVPGG